MFKKVSLAIKYTLTSLFFVSLIIFAISALINIYILFSSDRYIYSDISKIPKANVAMVLGTAKYVKRGKINYFYKYRMDAAAKLYKEGIVKAILVSGDNASKYYNEPARMRSDLIQRGVPLEKIYADYAGFRTLDSVKRAQSVFGLKRYIIVSQKFHLQRAIFIARATGAEAYGFEAKEFKYSKVTMKMNIREFFARVKAFLDIYLLHTKPKFFGKFEKIPIKENSDD
jgi:SanA protein